MTEYLGKQTQVDTYFPSLAGRFKLRQIDTTLGQLVYYERPDERDAKTSEYEIVAVPEPDKLRVVLERALGALVCVRKVREIFLYHNVRIHLDQVEGLGDFLEFEAVLLPHQSPSVGVRQVEYLKQEFQISDEHLLRESYRELLLGTPRAAQARPGRVSDSM